jgi:osmotically-inducible protein OsmY
MNRNHFKVFVMIAVVLLMSGGTRASQTDERMEVAAKKSVDNLLQLKAEHPTENPDGWISMQVKYSLLYNRRMKGISPKVFVKDGVVTLQGLADSQTQKDRVSQVVRDVHGVTRVVNNMIIQNSLSKN